jgi:hypothetical protein
MKFIVNLIKLVRRFINLKGTHKLHVVSYNRSFPLEVKALCDRVCILFDVGPVSLNLLTTELKCHPL